jgi:hypothetical protein
VITTIITTRGETMCSWLGYGGVRDSSTERAAVMLLSGVSSGLLSEWATTSAALAVALHITLLGWVGRCAAGCVRGGSTNSAAVRLLSGRSRCRPP